MAWFQKKPGASPAARAQPPLERVYELLNERAVIFPPAAADKTRVLELTAAAACAAHGLGEPGPFLAKAREREEGMSTTLDTGLSLPHARVDGLTEIAAALAVLPHGVTDPKAEGVRVRAMFLFFSPNRQEAFGRHLQVLRGVSAVFTSAALDALTQLKTPEAVLAFLKERQP